MDPALCFLTPASSSDAELRHCGQKESDGLIYICGCHIQVLKEWLHGIVRLNQTYVAIGNNLTTLQTTVYMREWICKFMNSEGIDTLWTTLGLQLEAWMAESESQNS